MKNNFPLLLLIAVIAMSNFQTATAQSWKLTGNGGTKASTNFIGTTDLKALSFRTNNIEQMRIGASGNVGIGTKTPLARLHVENGPFVNLSSPGCFQIGAANSTNLGMDYSAIQARYNGTASRLYLNYFGGDIWMGTHNATPTAALYVSEDGRVAIGSDDVNLYALTVNSSPSVIGTIYSSNTESGVAVYADANLGHGVFGYSTEKGFGVF